LTSDVIKIWVGGSDDDRNDILVPVTAGLSIDRFTQLERIARTRARLKIVLKTRDDPFFLNNWVAHHGALVGMENLIVLDNGSTDPVVLAAYAALHQSTPILRTEGYYNDVHWPGRCADFYKALRAGSDYFLYLDTDEFLAYSDGWTLGADRGSLAALEDRIPGDFIPTTCLNCVDLYRNRFFIGTDDVALRRQLKWGKPIIRAASTGWPELINHNLHLRGALKPYPHPGFFVLHLAYLSPEQRIRSNVVKLAARGFMKADEPLEEALLREPPEDAWMVRIYLDEIRRMRTLRGKPVPEDAPLSSGTMKTAADGTLAFASTVEQRVFRSYVERFADLVHEVIVEGRWPPA
jgi:Glycosyl transferase family 2